MYTRSVTFASAVDAPVAAIAGDAGTTACEETAAARAAAVTDVKKPRREGTSCPSWFDADSERWVGEGQYAGVLKNASAAAKAHIKTPVEAVLILCRAGVLKNASAAAKAHIKTPVEAVLILCRAEVKNERAKKWPC